MKLLLLITSRKKSEIILKHIANMHLLGAYSFMGKGTATGEILDALNLVETDKDVVFALVEDKNIEPIFAELEDKFRFTEKGTGVAVAMSLNGISAQTLELLRKEINEGEIKE